MFGVADALKRKEIGLGRPGSESKSRKEVNGNILLLPCSGTKPPRSLQKAKL